MTVYDSRISSFANLLFPKKETNTHQLRKYLYGVMYTKHKDLGLEIQFQKRVCLLSIHLEKYYSVLMKNFLSIDTISKERIEELILKHCDIVSQRFLENKKRFFLAFVYACSFAQLVLMFNEETHHLISTGKFPRYVKKIFYYSFKEKFDTYGGWDEFEKVIKSENIHYLVDIVRNFYESPECFYTPISRFSATDPTTVTDSALATSNIHAPVATALNLSTDKESSPVTDSASSTGFVLPTDSASDTSNIHTPVASALNLTIDKESTPDTDTASSTGCVLHSDSASDTSTLVGDNPYHDTDDVSLNFGYPERTDLELPNNFTKKFRSFLQRYFRYESYESFVGRELKKELNEALNRLNDFEKEQSKKIHPERHVQEIPVANIPPEEPFDPIKERRQYTTRHN